MFRKTKKTGIGLYVKIAKTESEIFGPYCASSRKTSTTIGRIIQRKGLDFQIARRIKGSEDGIEKFQDRIE